MSKIAEQEKKIASLEKKIERRKIKLGEIWVDHPKNKAIQKDIQYLEKELDVEKSILHRMKDE